MPEDWSKLRDIDPLADAQACIDFELPFSAFPRLAAQLASPAGQAQGRVCFDRDAGVAVAEVQVSAQALLTCQRCLAAMPWSFSGSARVALVGDAAEAERVPAELETILAPEHRLSVRDLVEEQLLIELPLVARHEQAECPPPVSAQGAEESGERHKPFAGLDELMKQER
ncbi:MAG TPA: YceD family protein [Steroidobacteraceae bacterium]|nr:YceD family protein [Steroidobacteraceae bacterium]